jgi:type II secretory pathway component GspD/PulD (secretin)
MGESSFSPRMPLRPPTTLVSPSDAQEVPLEASPSSDVEKSGGSGDGAGPGLKATLADVLPTASKEGPLVTIVVKDQSIEQVIDKIRKITGVTVRAKGKTAGEKVSLLEVNHPLEVVLDAIAKPKTWRWVKRSDGSYDIYDQESYVNEVLSQRIQRKEFALKYIEAEDLDKVVKDMLTPELGSSAPDARTNKLIVTDMPDKLAMIESIIHEYDVQLYTRVFEVVNADTDDLAQRLDTVKSKNATIDVDSKNHLILVRDETLEKLKVMEQILGLLDRDQEICVYNLNNIGEGGKDAEALVKSFIQPIVTKDATLEFNEATSLLYVKDVRVVQKKLLEILRQVDRPRKQVLIEGEMLQVSTAINTSLGMTWGATSGTAYTGLKWVNYPSGTLASAGLTASAVTNWVNMTFNATLNDARTRLLLKPSLILGNHKKGSIAITREDPVQTSYVSDSTNNNYTTSSQTFIDSGLTVEITPAISNRGLVELDISFEDSSSFQATLGGTSTTGGTIGYGKNTQKAETVMLAPSGQMRVIGGLITHNLGSTTAGIPFFSQIPYLGFLFGTKTKADTLSNLMFFVTPTILETDPLNDVIVEPVNAEAKLAMLQSEKQAAEPAKNANAIPTALKPYLEQIRPRSIAYPDTAGDMATSATMNEAALTSATLASEAALKAGGALLKNEPPPVVLLTENGDVVKVGGVNTDKPGKLGPTVAFGTTGGKGGRTMASKKSSATSKTSKTKASTTAPTPKGASGQAGVSSRSKTPSTGSSLTNSASGTLSPGTPSQ